MSSPWRRIDTLSVDHNGIFKLSIGVSSQVAPVPAYMELGTLLIAHILLHPKKTSSCGTFCALCLEPLDLVFGKSMLELFGLVFVAAGRGLCFSVFFPNSHLLRFLFERSIHRFLVEDFSAMYTAQHFHQGRA
jgi:hypothetical protein